MDIGAIFIVLAVIVLVGMYVSRPLLEKRSQVVGELERHQSELLAERDRVLNALQELDFDHNLEKIPPDEYPHRRTALLQRGIEVLQRLDEYKAQAVSASEDKLEAAIAARRASLSPGDAPTLAEVDPDDTMEMLIAQRRSKTLEKAAGFCPGCGKPVQRDDRFCPQCGTTLT